MKFLKALIFMIVFFFAATSVYAVDLAWDVNSDNPIGYTLYFNEKADTDTPYNLDPILHPTATASIPNDRFVPGKVYVFWVTAYNAEDESAPSNLVEWTAPLLYLPPSENLPTIHIPAPPEIPSSMMAI
jgi:hypothetical protein